MIKKLLFICTAAVLITVFIPCILFFFFSSVGIENQKKIDYDIPAHHVAAKEYVTSYLADKNEVKTFPFEEYITCVVAAEMPASFNEEALKAQAVAARSYIYNKIQTGMTHENGANVCTDVNHCKAYISKDDLKQKWGDDFNAYFEKISNCVKETENMVMIYDGEIIDALFHSTSSGKTENASDIWGKSIPYLVSVSSFGDELSPKFKSSVTVSIDEFKEKIKQAYPESEFDTSKPLIGEAERTNAGTILSIPIGNIILSGAELRKVFSLYSANIDFTVSDTEITMNVSGNGHGVGMSQYGANYLASQSKSFIEILKTYYTGVEVVKLKR